MKSADFLYAAEDLLQGKSKPRQANLRRACSSTYYALFHTLCDCSAGMFVRDKSLKRAWTQAYRALNHANAKNKCKKINQAAKFPSDIVDFANMFVQMQEKRHRADYDPSETYYKSAVKTDIDAVRAAINSFKTADKRHKRAFVVYIALDGPRS